MSGENKKKVVYCAGRMRGLPYYGFPAFDEAKARLNRIGFDVLSPADMDRAEGFDPMSEQFLKHVVPMSRDGKGGYEPDWSRIPNSFNLAAAIERDNKAIDKSDGIYVIHEGIGESKGGMAEIERGMSKGKVIVYDTMDDEAILKELGVSETVDASKVDWRTLDAEYEEARAKMSQAPRYTEREGVLDEAKKLITGDRNASYGPPSQDFRRTADMMTALFSAKLKEGARFKPSDVAWIITLVKASRAQHSPKRDNYVDAAGYMGCGWECEHEDLQRETPGVQQGAKGTHV